MSIKIGFVHQEFPFGGAEKVTSNIAKYLLSKNYEVFVFTSIIHKDKLSSMDKDITFVKVNKHDFKNTKKNLLVNKAIEFKIDILVFVGCLNEVKREELVKRIGCKYIYALHGTPFWEIENNMQNLIRKGNNKSSFFDRWRYKYFKIPLYRFFNIIDNRIKKQYQNVYNNCDAFLVLCNNYKTELITKLGIKEDNKIYVIPNGLPPATINYSSKKQKKLLYMGRMSYADKRVDRLLEVWKKIYKDFSDWEFLLVGDGAERTKLEKKAKDYKLERIKFCGETTTPCTYYNDSAILCLSSSIESWGLVLVEAQQAGVIPIAFDCSAGVREILSPSWENGILVTPFNLDEYEQNLRKLMINDKKREKMQENVMKKSLRYEINNVIEKWNNLFMNILNEKDSYRS